MVIVAVLIAFLAIGSANYYVAKKLHKGLSYFFKGLKFWMVCTFFTASTVIFVLGFMRGSLPFPEGLKSFLGTVAFYWMGIFLYLLVYSILSDIFILFCRLFKWSIIKKPFTRAFTVLVILILTVTTSAYGFYNARDIDKVYYDVKLQTRIDVSDIKLVMFSDLHLGAEGSESRVDTIVSEINALKPDVVCIAGDFFDTDFDAIADPQKAIDSLKRIKSTYGVYACLGNHDAGSTFYKMVDFLEKANIRALNDEYVVIDERLVLLGRLDGSPIGGFKEIKRKAVNEIFVRENKELPVVVLDHNPKNFSQYNDEADLILSGHTHKGQIFPANLVTNILYEVDYGYYQKPDGGPQIIVTSGIGYWGMPMRVGSNSELVVVNFKN